MNIRNIQFKVAISVEEQTEEDQILQILIRNKAKWRTGEEITSQNNALSGARFPYILFLTEKLVVSWMPASWTRSIGNPPVLITAEEFINDNQ